MLRSMFSAISGLRAHQTKMDVTGNNIANVNTVGSTDFMIEGDGFFVTRSGTEQLFTRAGSFDFDGQGNLVTPDGAVLQGWTANAAGVINTNGPIGDLKVPYGQI